MKFSIWFIAAIGLLALLVGVRWTIQLKKQVSLARNPIGHFGRPKHQLSKDERGQIRNELVRQVRSAYSLVLFATGASVVLGIVIVARVALAKELDLKLLSGAIAAAGNLGLGVYARKLFRETSSRLSRFMGTDDV
jgi:hypothetical protein